MDPSLMCDDYSFRPRMDTRLQTGERGTSVRKMYTKEIVLAKDVCLGEHAKIRTIPRYSLYFSPILKCEHIQANTGRLIVSREKTTSLLEFFYEKKQNDVLSYVVSSLRRLLLSFELLTAHDIIYTNYTSIAFNSWSVPVLYDFGGKPVMPYYIPIELFMLESLKQEETYSPSRENIQSLCERYFKLIDTDVSDQSVRECVEFLTPIINKPLSDVVDHLNTYKHKWYIYGLGRVYLRLLGALDIVEMPAFLPDLLTRCVSVSPTQRPTVAEMITGLDTDRMI